MKFGYVVNNFGTGHSLNSMKEEVNALDPSIFSSLWFTDHIILPKSNPFTLFNNISEPLVTMSIIGALFRQYRIGISTLVLPRRNPFIVAKQLSTIDFLLEGRLEVTLGIGLIEEEFAMLGYSFSERGRILNEQIELIHHLWQNKPTFHGNYYNYQDAIIKPRPYNGRVIPILVAGNSKFALARALEYGSGWHPVNLSPTQLQQQISQYSLPDDFNITLRLSIQKLNELSGHVSEYQNIGVDHLIMYTPNIVDIPEINAIIGNFQ